MGPSKKSNAPIPDGIFVTQLWFWMGTKYYINNWDTGMGQQLYVLNIVGQPNKI